MSNGDLLRVRNFGKKHLEELQVALQSQQRPGGAQHADFGSGARGLVAYEAVGS